MIALCPLADLDSSLTRKLGTQDVDELRELLKDQNPRSHASKHSVVRMRMMPIPDVNHQIHGNDALIANGIKPSKQLAKVQHSLQLEHRIYFGIHNEHGVLHSQVGAEAMLREFIQEQLAKDPLYEGRTLLSADYKLTVEVQDGVAHHILPMAALRHEERRDYIDVWLNFSLHPLHKAPHWTLHNVADRPLEHRGRYYAVHNPPLRFEKGQNDLSEQQKAEVLSHIHAQYDHKAPKGVLDKIREVHFIVVATEYKCIVPPNGIFFHT